MNRLNIAVLSCLFYFSGPQLIRAQVTKIFTSRTRIGAGISISRPLHFGQVYDVGLGGNLQAEFPLTQKGYIITDIGSNRFYASDSKNPLVTTYDLQLLDLGFGVKYFFIHNFYMQIKSGASIVTNPASSKPDNKIAFNLTPQIGLLQPLNAKNALDFSFRYEMNAKLYRTQPHFNFPALRVGYTFLGF